MVVEVCIVYEYGYFRVLGEEFGDCFGCSMMLYVLVNSVVC